MPQPPVPPPPGRRRGSAVGCGQHILPVRAGLTTNGCPGHLSEGGLRVLSKHRRGRPKLE